MSAGWHNKPWRKLYTELTGQWLSLPVSARGLGSELIKYAKEDGTVAVVGNRNPGAELARIMGAMPDEWERIAADVTALLEDGYLILEDGALKIRNFGSAQERHSPAAVKQRRYRERKQRDTATGNDNGGVTVTRYHSVTEPRYHSVTEPRYGNVTEPCYAPLPGNETKRNETSVYNTRVTEQNTPPEQPPGWLKTAWCNRAGLTFVDAAALAPVWPLVRSFAAGKGTDPRNVIEALFDAYEDVTSSWDTKHNWTPALFVRHFDRIQSAANAGKKPNKSAAARLAEVQRDS